MLKNAHSKKKKKERRRWLKAQIRRPVFSAWCVGSASERRVLSSDIWKELWVSLQWKELGVEAIHPGIRITPGGLNTPCGCTLDTSNWEETRGRSTLRRSWRTWLGRRMAGLPCLVFYCCDVDLIRTRKRMDGPSLATPAAWPYGWQCLPVHHFGPDWNISATMGWIVMKFCTFMVPSGWILLILVILWRFL